MLTIAQLEELSHQLLPLAFQKDVDCQGCASPLASAYLKAYQLDTATQFPEVAHAFGRLDIRGFRIATHYWLPPTPKATLVVVHGYYDHVGLFDQAIRFALAQNFAVISFDLPGHGLSSGPRAAIDSFDTYTDVLYEVLGAAKSLLPSPFYGFGQSTGGSILLNYAVRFGNNSEAVPLSRLVLAAPLIIPCGWRLGRVFYYLLKPFVRTLKRGSSRSSHDPAFTHFVECVDPLQAKELSIQWVGAMNAWHRRFVTLPTQTTKLLVVQGDADQTVDWRYNTLQIKSRFPHAQIVMIKGAGHQLINESPPYRDQLLAEMAVWLN